MPWFPVLVCIVLCLLLAPFLFAGSKIGRSRSVSSSVGLGGLPVRMLDLMFPLVL